jgi:hypothetical protein
MLRRRRPLARAAVVGGVAHAASKAGAASAAREAETAPAEGSQGQMPVAEPTAAPPADTSMEELTKLKGLLDACRRSPLQLVHPISDAPAAVLDHVDTSSLVPRTHVGAAGVRVAMASP